MRKLGVTVLACLGLACLGTLATFGWLLTGCGEALSRSTLRGAVALRAVVQTEQDHQTGTEGAE